MGSLKGFINWLERKEVKKMKEYKRIKAQYKRAKTAELKKLVATIRHEWDTFATSWRYKEELTERQRKKPIKEQKQLLIEKLTKGINKQVSDFNEKADKIAQAKDLKELYINVEWARSRVWGMNPHAEIWGNGYFTGSASGCGYDKLSSAVAEALNKNYSALKLIYNLYEKELRKNPNATPHSVNYGMGYLYPYYEGGVGYSCFSQIFKKAGAKVNEHRATKTSDIMIINF